MCTMTDACRLVLIFSGTLRSSQRHRRSTLYAFRRHFYIGICVRSVRITFAVYLYCGWSRSSSHAGTSDSRWYLPHNRVYFQFRVVYVIVTYALQVFTQLSESSVSATAAALKSGEHVCWNCSGREGIAANDKLHLLYYSLPRIRSKKTFSKDKNVLRPLGNSDRYWNGALQRDKKIGIFSGDR